MTPSSQKNILIVEDDDRVAGVYRTKLAQGGMGSMTAKNGEEGLRKIISEKPDLILLDLMLPKADGFWVLEALRRDPKLRKTPVIVLSNLSQKSDEKRALHLGAKEYIIKAEVSIKHIVEQIKYYVRQ